MYFLVIKEEGEFSMQLYSASIYAPLSPSEQAFISFHFSFLYYFSVFSQMCKSASHLLVNIFQAVDCLASNLHP